MTQTRSSALLARVVSAFPFCSSHKIRVTPKRVSAIDFLYAARNVASKMSKPSATIITGRILRKHASEFDIQLERFPYCKNEGTPMLLEKDLRKFLRLVVVGARIPMEKKRELLGEDVPMRQFTEEEIRAQLVRVFPHMRKQRFGQYTVDYYLAKYRLIIECDEDGHGGYCKEREKQRSEYLASRGLIVLRFDPYAKDFDVFELISTIFAKMTELGDNDPVELTESETESAEVPTEAPIDALSESQSPIPDVTSEVAPNTIIESDSDWSDSDAESDSSLDASDSEYELVGPSKELLRAQTHLERLRLARVRQQVKLAQLRLKILRLREGSRP